MIARPGRAGQSNALRAQVNADGRILRQLGRTLSIVQYVLSLRDVLK